MRQKVVLILFLLLGLVAFFENHNWFFNAATVKDQTGLSDLQRAFENRLSNVQVEGAGTVKTILADDTRGIRHQRFILSLDDGLTVLVAHNLDLAPRIDMLRVGDIVSFSGEYEWNEKGGVIHWTHHDPAGKHAEGWLRHKERIYR